MSNHVVEIPVKIYLEEGTEERKVRYDLDDIGDICRVIFDAFGENLGCEESDVNLADQDTDQAIWDTLKPIVHADFGNDIVNKGIKCCQDYTSTTSGDRLCIVPFLNRMEAYVFNSMPKDLVERQSENPVFRAVYENFKAARDDEDSDAAALINNFYSGGFFKVWLPAREPEYWLKLARLYTYCAG